LRHLPMQIHKGRHRWGSGRRCLLPLLIPLQKGGRGGGWRCRPCQEVPTMELKCRVLNMTAVQAYTPACGIAPARACSRAGRTGAHDCMTDKPGAGWAGGTWCSCCQGMGGGGWGDNRGGRGRSGGACRVNAAQVHICQGGRAGVDDNNDGGGNPPSWDNANLYIRGDDCSIHIYALLTPTAASSADNDPPPTRLDKTHMIGGGCTSTRSSPWPCPPMGRCSLPLTYVMRASTPLQGGSPPSSHGGGGASTPSALSAWHGAWMGPPMSAIVGLTFS
jgi:hypothetical protein